MKTKTVKEHLVQAHGLFILISVFFGLVFVNIIPPFWGQDEPAHFARVYQIAHGQLLPHLDKQDYGGKIPQNLKSFNDYVVGDLVDNKGGNILSRTDVDNEGVYSLLEKQHFSTEQSRYLWTSTYSPVAYVGPTIAVLVAEVPNASIGHTLLLARIFTLVVYVALVGSALYFLRNYKLRWVIFTVALLPVSLFQAVVISADSLAVGLSLLFFSLLLRLKLNSENKKLIYPLVAAAILLPLTKPNYIFVSLGILALPNSYFRNTRNAAIAKISTITASFALVTLWSKFIGVASSPVSQRPDGLSVNPAGQVSWLMHHPVEFVVIFARTLVVNVDQYIREAFIQVGWNYVNTPLFLLLLLVIGVFLAALYAKDEIAKLNRLLLLFAGLSLLGVISIFGSLYVGFSPVAFPTVDGVQGRYFIPFLLPVVLLVSAYVPVRLNIKLKNMTYICCFVSIAGLLLTTTYYALSTT